MAQVNQAAYFNQKKHRFPAKDILNPPHFQLLELQALRQALNLPASSHLLDFGAGSGRLTIFFLRQGYHITALDISQGSLQVLKALYIRHRTPSWGKLALTTKPPAKPVFDGLIGSDVLHHVNLQVELPRLKTCLKPGAHIAFTEPNAWHLPWYLYLLAAKIPWAIEKRIVNNNILYLKHTFSQAGFKDITIQGHGLLPTPISTHPLNLTLGRLLTPTAFRLIIQVRK